MQPSAFQVLRNFAEAGSISPLIATGMLEAALFAAFAELDLLVAKQKMALTHPNQIKIFEQAVCLLGQKRGSEYLGLLKGTLT